MDERIPAIEVAHRRAVEYVNGVRGRPVWPAASYDDMLAALGGDLPADGQDPAAVVDQLADLAGPGLMGITSGRFFGFVIGSSLPAAIGADWLTTTWDQNAGLTASTPAAVAAETVAGRWLVELLGLPAGSAVGLVTGATMASFTCLAVARNETYRRHGWDLAEQGMAGAPPLRFVVGEHRHGSVDRAAKLLGIGSSQFVVVPAAGDGTVDVQALTETLDRLGDGLTVVVLQAGEVNTGAFDDFAPAISAAHRHGAWVHVDGAFGLWAAASSAFRHLTAGVEAADSWATDAHKTLNVPYDNGVAVVRDAEAVQRVFGSRAHYLMQGAGDPSDRVPELSRRARGFTIWAAVRSLGRSGVEALVDGLARHAARFADGVRAIPGLEVVNRVDFTQVMVAAESDEATERLGVALREEGTAVLTPSRWGGRGVLRCSMSSWVTTDDDVDRTVDALRRLHRPAGSSG
jgi:glutamate/tyrosine decarboxylase-like PLP-dependent enzyme